MWYEQQERERERGREGERETLVAPRNIVHRRIAARHATFDNFIIMNSSSSKKLYPFRIDIRSRSCSKSITLSRASDEIESLSARDRPQAMVSNVRLQTSSCFSRSEHASSTVCLIFQWFATMMCNNGDVINGTLSVLCRMVSWYN